MNPALPNPFRDAVVQDAWQSPTDVPEIHHAAFRDCLSVIETAGRGVPDSLLLYGPAGAGKTHLLSRVQRHLHRTRAEAPERRLPCVFVFVRLQTASQLLWQHVRRRLVSDLTRRDQGLNQIEQLLAYRLALRLNVPHATALVEFRALRDTCPELVLSEIEALRNAAQLPRDLVVVLEHLLFERKVRDACAWLMGESLPEATLADLGLGLDLATDREQAAREMVTLLCRLAAGTLPVVFCFDQIEALQRSADDRDAFFQFGQMAADLHDAAPRVALITCLQSAVLDQFKSAVRQADLQRMAKRHSVLHSLTRQQVSALVVSRLELLQSLRAHAADQPYYPFTSVFVSNLADEAPAVPRGILSRCARQFDELQQGVVPEVPSLQEFMSAELTARRLQALQASQAGETPRILLHALPVVAAACGASLRTEDAEGADWLIDHGTRAVAVTVRNEADGRTLAPKLKAVLDKSPRQDGAPWVLLRDPRLTLSKAAVRTRERLSELEARGARVVEPTLDTLATLDALQALSSDAKSGDLARGGDVVEVSKVLAWLKTGLTLGADELECVQRFWGAVTGSDGRLPALAPQPELRPATAAEPGRLDAELASSRTPSAPLSAMDTTPVGDERARPARAAEPAAPAIALSAAAPEGRWLDTFRSWFARRRPVKDAGSVAAAARLSSLLRE